MNDPVEIVRQPILVLRQLSETFLRALKFADFAGNIGMLSDSWEDSNLQPIDYGASHPM